VFAGIRQISRIRSRTSRFVHPYGRNQLWSKAAHEINLRKHTSTILPVQRKVASLLYLWQIVQKIFI
jgi:hypothetical protein